MWVLLGHPSRPPRAKGELPSLLLRLTNLLGYLFLILVNILSATGALGGTNGEISKKFPTPLTPSGWAFAIWGIIFALEALGVIYQIMNSGYLDGGWKTSVITKIGYGWQVGWLLQDLWQFFFARESVPGMWLAAFALLGALAAFQITLHRLNGTTHELRARGFVAMPAAAYVCYKLPTAMNAAWLSVAAALGLLIVPVSYGVEQARLVVPAAVLAVAVTAGGSWRLLRHRDVAYGLTLIWALSAVASNDSGSVPTAVKVVGIVCLVVLALFVVAALVRTRRELSATGVDGSLLHDTYNSPYSPYGEQRILLSDSDSPAGYARTAANFTFTPALHEPVGGAAVVGAAAAEGVAPGAAAHRAPPPLLSAPGAAVPAVPAGRQQPQPSQQQQAAGTALGGDEGGEFTRVSLSGGAAVVGPSVGAAGTRTSLSGAGASGGPALGAGSTAAPARAYGQVLWTETAPKGAAGDAGRRVRFLDEEAANGVS